jgi:hypothetical protein
MTERELREGTHASAIEQRVWAMMERHAAEMGELRDRQKETDRQLKETDRLLIRQSEETDRRFRAQSEEADRRFRAQAEEADRRFRQADGKFDSRWGRFLESLVEGDLVPLLRARGVEVDQTSTRHRKSRNGEHMEIDIVALNGREAVVVEVKTTLRPEAVNRFVEKLRVFQDWFQDHRSRTIYGAMAYLESGEGVARYAESQGLFLIRATGSSASIVNAPDFKPRDYS